MRYWYVLVEMYDTGRVKAAVVNSRPAAERPPEFYKQEFGRELYGEWFDSLREAEAARDEALALNMPLVQRAA